MVNTNIYLFPIDENVAMKTIKEISVKTSRIDMSCFLLKFVACNVLEPLVHLINCTMKSGSVPNELKTSNNK